MRERRGGPLDIDELLSLLRRAGGDTADIEVKSAVGGLPESVTPSLSALANLPGGGFIILGLDEGAGFAPVGLTDPQALKQGLSSRARLFTPPVHLDLTDGQVGGLPIVVAQVAECDPSAKPCRVASTGKAYLRSDDGDYELSGLEQQAFLAARTPPRSDRQPVHGTSVADLDRDLVEAWTDSVASTGHNGLGRFLGDEAQLLLRAGVVTSDGELTLAGLLVLGAYPQQHFPRLVVQVAAEAFGVGVRARNVQAIDGPIPVMLDRTLDWLRANVGTTTIADDSGQVREVPDFPLLALRGLVANALVHRDLAAWAEGQAVEVRVGTNKIVIANPGGLYGISVDRLGRDHVTSARNTSLVALCQNARTAPRGERIIEALASGIPDVLEELRAAGLPPACFHDAGIRFTVVLRRPDRASPTSPVLARSMPAPPPGSAHPPRPDTNQAAVLTALRSAPDSTVSDLAQTTALPATSVRRALTRLRQQDLAVADGGPGRVTRYRVHDSLG